MSRLRSELQRLYLPPADAGSGTASCWWADAQGRVRALVMEVARPASWELIGRVWLGVQTELELPAPGIAVSGTDGLQLWFSLAEPIAASEALAFLEALRSRFLTDVALQRVRLLPSPAGTHVDPVPARHAPSGNWSAFVASDLAPVFADTPWLDIAPNEEGQATLLRGLTRIAPSALEAARERLERPAPPSTPVAEPASRPPDPAANETSSEPRRFLLRVMNDETVALALRIEAAKALLPPAPRG